MVKEKQTCGNFHWISQLNFDFEWKVLSSFSFFSGFYPSFPLPIWDIPSKLLNVGKSQLMIISSHSQEPSEMWAPR